MTKRSKLILLLAAVVGFGNRAFAQTPPNPEKTDCHEDLPQPVPSQTVLPQTVPAPASFSILTYLNSFRTPDQPGPGEDPERTHMLEHSFYVGM
jgi:hypothetical protein